MGPADGHQGRAHGCAQTRSQSKARWCTLPAVLVSLPDLADACRPREVIGHTSPPEDRLHRPACRCGLACMRDGQEVHSVHPSSCLSAFCVLTAIPLLHNDLQEGLAGADMLTWQGLSL